MLILSDFQFGKEPWERVFSLPHNNIIRIRGHLPPAGSCMGPPDNGDAVRICNLIMVPGFADRIQGITGNIRCRLWDRMQVPAGRFTCCPEDGE